MDIPPPADVNEFQAFCLWLVEGGGYGFPFLFFDGHEP